MKNSYTLKYPGEMVCVEQTVKCHCKFLVMVSICNRYHFRLLQGLPCVSAVVVRLSV